MGKSNHIFALLLGLIFFLSASITVAHLESQLDTSISNAEISLRKDKCDIFTGKWIPNPSGPAYTNATCKFIPDYVDCLTNGRPDRDYLYWRWKPDGCDLPRFDADVFLNAMRDKSLALIGDSLVENHFNTILCLLSQAEEPVLVYSDKEYKYRRWRFSRNFTLSFIWSPTLAKAENTDGKSSEGTQLHLDILDSRWTDEYHRFDHVLINTGEWFLIKTIFWENGTVIGCNYCPGKNLPELGSGNAYRRVLRMVFDFIKSSDHKPVVLFRTRSPTHYEDESEGPSCNRSRPYHEGQYNGTYNDHLLTGILREEFSRAAAGIGERSKLFDIYHLSLLRPDGHPGTYGVFKQFSGSVEQTDCTHWCLPGAIDSWNDLLMHMVLEEQNSSTSS